MAGSWLPDPDSPGRKLVQLKVGNYGLLIKMLRSSESELERAYKQALCTAPGDYGYLQLKASF